MSSGRRRDRAGIGSEDRYTTPRRQVVRKGVLPRLRRGVVASRNSEGGGGGEGL